jgi:hypothetical protein
MGKWCGLCGGEKIKMGKLGNRLHLRCQSCGMWFSRLLKRRDSLFRLQEHFDKVGGGES